jgi:hypothetical protein
MPLIRTDTYIKYNTKQMERLSNIVNNEWGNIKHIAIAVNANVFDSICIVFFL